MGATRAPLALTCGDPAGIGPEIALKAWQRLSATANCFVYLGDAHALSVVATKLGLTPPTIVATPADAIDVFPGNLPVIHQPLSLPPRPGHAEPANVPAIIRSIDVAVEMAMRGSVSAIVTNPIHKHTLYGAGFNFPGHTEYLAHLTHAASAPVMMLAIDGLRVVPVTVHLSVSDAVRTLTTAMIVHAAKTTHEALRRQFGIATPRLTIAALNPHAGEGGALGSEETTIIAPAIEQLRATGMNVFGPAPVDTLFHPMARERYDAALCMLHDHALLPLKTLDFDRGVNVTLGLPIIRTSPDHGTAFDIAGLGIANPDSLVAAIEMVTRLSSATRA